VPVEGAGTATPQGRHGLASAIEKIQTRWRAAAFGCSNGLHPAYAPRGMLNLGFEVQTSAPGADG
jgi:hypothetical protein